jgi:hypothetical protein
MEERKELAKVNYLLRGFKKKEVTPENSKKLYHLLKQQRTLTEKVVHENAENRFKKDVNPMIKDYIQTPERRRHLWDGN